MVGVRRLEFEHQDRDEHCEHTIREEAHPIGTELYAEVATSRLLWFNFAHLFSVSLIPFATEWIAESVAGPRTPPEHKN